MKRVMDFFSAVFGEIEDAYLSIWSDIDKKSSWFKDIEQAAKHASDLDKPKKGNIYFGIGLAPKPKKASERTTSNEIVAIPGFWADIDVDHPEIDNKEKRRFKSMDQAVAFAENIFPPELKPSILVFSGHGLQAYWLFKEPWTFDSAKERRDAQAKSKAFHETVWAKGKERGVDIDKTPDFARVFRVPLTHNVKATPVKAEVLRHHSDQRFNPTDFDEFLLEPSEIPTNEPGISDYSKNIYGLILSENNRLPDKFIEGMSSLDPKFELTWNRKRKDLRDQSLSEYDMSLANQCMSAGVEPQLIADLILAFRQRHAGRPEDIKKALRMNYINHTLLKAEEYYGDQKADHKADELLYQYNQHNVKPKEVNKPQHSETIQVLRQALKIPIARIVRYTGDNPKFQLEFDDGSEVVIGGADQLVEQGKLRRHIVDHCLIYLPKFKSEKWDKYANLIIKAVETVETGPETRRKFHIKELVQRFLDSQNAIKDWRTAYMTRRPFVKGERVYVFFDEMRSWINMNSEPIGTKDLGTILKGLGGDSQIITFEAGKKLRAYDVTEVVGFKGVTKDDAGAKVLQFAEATHDSTKASQI